MNERQKLLARMPYFMLHFLIEKKVLSNFVYNFLHANRSRICKKFYVLYIYSNVKIPITDKFIIAFDWKYSAEGFQYWNNLYKEFRSEAIKQSLI